MSRAPSRASTPKPPGPEMSPNQHGPAEIPVPGLEQVMATVREQYAAALRQEQERKDQAHKADIARLENTITTKDNTIIANNARISELERTITTKNNTIIEKNIRLDKLEPSDDETSDPDRKYCYCLGEEYGDMVRCDNRKCERKWFHLRHTGLTYLPDEDDSWFCTLCRGWEAELDLEDQCWRCPKCFFEVADDDNETFDEEVCAEYPPGACHPCGLRQGDPWQFDGFDRSDAFDREADDGGENEDEAENEDDGENESESESEIKSEGDDESDVDSHEDDDIINDNATEDSQSGYDTDNFFDWETEDGGSGDSDDERVAVWAEGGVWDEEDDAFVAYVAGIGRGMTPDASQGSSSPIAATPTNGTKRKADSGPPTSNKQKQQKTLEVTPDEAVGVR